MSWILDGLVVWGIAAPLAAYCAGWFFRGAVSTLPVEKNAGLTQPTVTNSRVRQHQFDKINNPNYRGAAKCEEL